MALLGSEQLAIWADLQKRQVELDRLRKRLQMTADETEAVRLALVADARPALWSPSRENTSSVDSIGST